MVIQIKLNYLGDCFNLRWFTPTVEVPLCGHATLASAAVLYYVIGMYFKTFICENTKFKSNIL